MNLRNPVLSDSVRQRAKVLQGSLEDATFVLRATEGAEALFWLTPPNVYVPNFRAYQNELGRNAAEVVRTNGIPYVVNLSSIGAHIPDLPGPIGGLGDVERRLDEVATNITHLRPGMFMENLLQQVEPLRAMGSIFGPFPSNVPIPMIATHDIGDAAAQRLLDRSWSGRNVLGLHGPADITYEEVAATLSEVLERPVRYVQISPEQFRDALIQQGASADFADEFVKGFEKLANAGFAAEPRTAETTTPTTLAQWAREALKPLVDAASTER